MKKHKNQQKVDNLVTLLQQLFLTEESNQIEKIQNSVKDQIEIIDYKTFKENISKIHDCLLENYKQKPDKFTDVVDTIKEMVIILDGAVIKLHLLFLAQQIDKNSNIFVFLDYFTEEIQELSHTPSDLISDITEILERRLRELQIEVKANNSADEEKLKKLKEQQNQYFIYFNKFLKLSLKATHHEQEMEKLRSQVSSSNNIIINQFKDELRIKINQLESAQASS